jgi:hypothetical protein
MGSGELQIGLALVVSVSAMLTWLQSGGLVK